MRLSFFQVCYDGVGESTCTQSAIKIRLQHVPLMALHVWVSWPDRRGMVCVRVCLHMQNCPALAWAGKRFFTTRQERCPLSRPKSAFCFATPGFPSQIHIVLEVPRWPLPCHLTPFLHPSYRPEARAVRAPGRPGFLARPWDLDA